MDATYWHKQFDEPLFPDLQWSRPQNRHNAGKLLIVGGNAHGFAAPAEAFQTANQAGIGNIRAILPSSIKTQLRHFNNDLLELDFLPSTPSGSFAQSGLAALLDHSLWSDSVLLAGDFGRNSETAILLESFAAKHAGQLVITKDAADYFITSPQNIVNRSQTLLVITLAQLQKLALNLHYPKPVTFNMGLPHLADWLHELTAQYSVFIVIKHLENLLVAVDGQVSSTKSGLNLEEHWRIATAASAAVWWLQNPNMPFEAITTAVFSTDNSA